MSDDLATPPSQSDPSASQESAQAAAEQIRQLQARLSQLETALTQVEQAIVCTDSHGQIEWCNAGFERLVDRSQTAIQQTSLLALLPLEELPLEELVHPVQQAIAGQLPQPAFYQFWQGDRAVVLQIHWSRTADQSLVFAIDLSDTDRKFADAQRKQQEFLRMVIDTDPNLIFVKDWEGRYLLANKSLASFYNLTVEEVLGKKIDDFFTDSALVNHFLSQNQRVIDQRQPLFIPEEATVNHPEVRWLQWQKQPIRLPDRDEYAVLGIGMDITDRKRSELALASILQGTASATGADFFPVLVQSLATALEVTYAIVTELINETQFNTLAFWADGQLQPNTVYNLADTPCCQQVINQGLFACPVDITQRFPACQPLKDLKAESYLGVALRDTEGRVIGTLCILGTQKLQDLSKAEALLQIFAARAAAELERQKAIAALQQLNQELEARVAQRTQELQQSQLELQHQTQLLQTVLNSLGDGVVVADQNNQLLIFNPAAYRILGIDQTQEPSDDLRHHYTIYLSDRITPCPPDQTPLQRARRGEIADNVEVFVRRLDDLPDRPGVLLDVTLRPLCNQLGETIGGVVTFRDISQRRAIEEILRQREAALRESEEQLRTVFENAPIAIGLADIADRYRIVRCNAALRVQIGYSEAEILQMTIADFTHPDDLATDLEQVQQLLNGEISRFQMQKRYRRKTGDLIWVKLTAALIHNAEGQHRYILGMTEDITELKQREADRQRAEAALRESEEKFRQLTETVQEVFWLRSAEDNLLYVSPSFEQIWGEPVERLYESPMLWLDSVHPADRDRVSPPRLGIELNTYEQEYRIVRQDGEIRWIHSCAFPVKNAQGDVYRIAGISKDITQRKQAEEALRTSETRLRRVIDSSMVGIFFSLNTGEITEANHAFLQMFGYTPADVAAGRLRWDEMSAPEYRALDPLMDQELRLHRVSSIYEKEFFHQDGTRIPVLLGVALIEEDQDEQEVAFVLNISDRKQAERRLLIVQEQLLIAQKRLQHLLCSSPAIIYSATPAETPAFTFISPNISQTLGYEPSECLSPDFWLTHLHPEDLPTFCTGMVHLLQQGYMAIEYRIRHQDGSYRWLYDQAQMVHDEAGKTLEQIGSWIDISERKGDEAHRKRAEEQLQQTNQRLALTNAELARATHLKDEFLANMSHELRTPLNSIIGLSEVMQEEVFGALTVKQHQFLETIQSSGKHLLDLINDILDLAKIEAGMLELNLTETSIQSLCEASLTLVRQQAHQKNITLAADLMADVQSQDAIRQAIHADAQDEILQGTILVDERRIRQVLINLLSNAIKFTPEGGSVTLKVHSSQSPSAQNQLSFSITDTGIGIAPQDLHKLFQTFVQLDSSLDRHYEGTGLGLALVKQITEIHGGQVSVESALGVGSCFTVTLPWIQAGELREQHPAQYQRQACSDNAPAPPASGCILWAESNPDSVAAIADSRQISSFEVIWVSDGLSLIQQAIADRPRLILMDLHLPRPKELSRLDGLEVIRRIRAHPDTASIPLIVLTAAAKLDEQASCLSVGANDYIAKPLCLEQLVRLIQTYVGMG